MTVEDIINVVVDPAAVYEVQRSLGLGHGQTRDLVLHRIDGRPQEVSRTDVIQRVRQCNAGAV